MKEFIILIFLLALNGCNGCRNTANPNSSGQSELNEPIRAPYDTGNEPATPESEVPKVANDSVD